MNILGSALSSIKPRKDDTFIDRLNYYYSSVIIIVMSLTLTAKQYVGQPIQCWVPAEFSKAWEQYAENYCFVHNTYWVRPGEDIPVTTDERLNQQLIYYQWVPFLMVLEAGFFYLPVLFWSHMNTKSGINIGSVVAIVENVEKGGVSANTTNTETRKAVLVISQQIEDSVRLRRVRQETATKIDWLWRFGLLKGSYLSNMYSITKGLYILNVIGQFMMMNKFLGQNDPAWGANILSDIVDGRDWELSGNFPRIALCDFSVRTLSNVQRYSIQCVLVLNMFNEKIFLFLYWWLVLVGGITFIDMIVWAMNTRLSSKRISYIKSFVHFVPEEEEFVFREFCDRLIAADGSLLLRMLSINTNELFTQEVLCVLWENYRTQAQLRSVVSENGGDKTASRRLSPAGGGDSTPSVEEDEEGEDPTIPKTSLTGRKASAEPFSQQRKSSLPVLSESSELLHQSHEQPAESSLLIRGEQMSQLLRPLKQKITAADSRRRSSAETRDRRYYRRGQYTPFPPKST